MRLRAALVGALLVVVTAGSAFGQGFQGGMRGAVKDSGGVVPGVEVTLTNESTNLSRSAVTNDRGEYSFPNVDAGTYKVRVALQGYKTTEQTGIRIGTQQFITLDLTMDVGTITESVTVTGQSPIIETSNASQGTVLDSAALQALPSPGRSAFMIGTTVPTVIPTGDTQFNRQQDQTNASLLSLGGGTRRGNSYTLDGVPITDMRNRAVANPTIEAIEDMKVQVHTYDAEMGATGGGVFNTTLKSGTNNFRGTAFYQTRPISLSKNNFFSDKANLPKPNNPYYLGGFGFGGPIVKNRTFFWVAGEDYTDTQTRNASEVMPTALERSGDFSRTTNAAGVPVVIYDPLTRQPFPGNQIPANRINPVSAAMLKYLPPADSNVSNGNTNYNRTSLIKSRWTQEYTGKVEHKFTDKVSLTGFYLYNRSDEPCANYFGTADQTEPNRFADPLDYLLKRRPQILAINNTWVVSDNSVMALRFGWTDFPDNNTLTADFDPSTLGFSQAYLNQITVQKFPQVRVRGYDQFAARTLGAIEPTQISWKSIGGNGSFSKFVGTHTFKMGADFRKQGVDTLIPGNGAGSFDFEKDTTSSDGFTTNNALNGNSFASFLLGFPSGVVNDRPSQLTLTTPLNVFSYYYGGYVQDDWRVNSKLTLNYGLRMEHQDGLREQNNNFTVGFDPNATSALSSVTIPATIDPTGGTPARTVKGGLMYAGVDGNKITQGNPPKVKWSPRVGAVYSLNTKTVLRGGYGVFWAPRNAPAPSPATSNYGQVGYTLNTLSPQTAPIPTVSLTNPFPNGVQQPSGNSLGTASGAGLNIAYADQHSTAPRVQQFSLDFQRELTGSQALLISYVGARGNRLGLGGSNDTAVNINQLDPKYLALGAALNQTVPNPFFGHPNAGPFATRATLSRAQLLRPFPQFANVNAGVLEGKNRYHAGVIEWSKRMTRGIGGRVSYTYSSLKDNQVGETNFYSGGGTNPLNNYNYIASAPACTTTNFAACYNPDADYGTSLLDVPHRVIIAPMFELPFGRGKKWGSNSSVTEWIAGGWTIVAAINVQSGFPLSVQQTDNTGLLGGVQRPNIVPGATLGTPGSTEDRYASADHPTAAWLNPAAFTGAPAFTFGNAPRTITEQRSPGQFNVDGVFSKRLRFGSKTAEVKVEMLNMLNRVQVRALQARNTFGNANFGTIGAQAGFMRITQLMFRFSF